MKMQLTDLPPEILQHITQYVRLTDLPEWVSSSKIIKTSYDASLNHVNHANHANQSATNEQRKQVGFMLNKIKKQVHDPQKKDLDNLRLFLKKTGRDAEKFALIGLFTLWQECWALEKTSLEKKDLKTATGKVLAHSLNESQKNLELSLLSRNVHLQTKILFEETQRLCFLGRLSAYQQSKQHKVFHTLNDFSPLFFNLHFVVLMSVLLPLISFSPINYWLKDLLMHIWLLFALLYHACWWLKIDIEKSAMELLTSPYAIDEIRDDLMNAYMHRLGFYERLGLIKNKIEGKHLTDFSCHDLDQLNLNFEMN
jgi:hypothetical protein